MGATGPTAANVGIAPWHFMDPIIHPDGEEVFRGRTFSAPVERGCLGSTLTTAADAGVSGNGHPARGFFPFLQQRTTGFAGFMQQHFVRHMSAFRQPQL